MFIIPNTYHQIFIDLLMGRVETGIMGWVPLWSLFDGSKQVLISCELGWVSFCLDLLTGYNCSI
jgi:hypothetical protein